MTSIKNVFYIPEQTDYYSPFTFEHLILTSSFSYFPSHAPSVNRHLLLKKIVERIENMEGNDLFPRNYCNDAEKRYLVWKQLEPLFQNGELRYPVTVSQPIFTKWYKEWALLIWDWRLIWPYLTSLQDVTIELRGTFGPSSKWPEQTERFAFALLWIAMALNSCQPNIEIKTKMIDYILFNSKTILSFFLPKLSLTFYPYIAVGKNLFLSHYDSVNLPFVEYVHLLKEMVGIKTSNLEITL